MEIGFPLGMGIFLDNMTVNPEVYNQMKLEASGNNQKETTPVDPLEEEVEQPSLFDKKKEKTILNNRCYLFYGPSGTGKEMMVKTLAYETNSLLFSMATYLYYIACIYLYIYSTICIYYIVSYVFINISLFVDITSTSIAISDLTGRTGPRPDERIFH